MDPIERKINDVDFEKTNHLGNKTFFSYIRSLIEDGSYFPSIGQKKKKDVIARIQRHMALCDPPTRFLNKRIKDRKVYFEILYDRTIKERINSALKKEWAEMEQNHEGQENLSDPRKPKESKGNHPKGDPCKAKEPKNRKNQRKQATQRKDPCKGQKTKNPPCRATQRNHFHRLLYGLAKDTSYDHSDQQKRQEFVREIREYMEVLFPKGYFSQLSEKNIARRVQIALNTELNRIRKNENVKSHFEKWKKKKSEGKTMNEKELRQSAVEEEEKQTNGDGNGDGDGDGSQYIEEDVDTEELQAMEKRYPIGTKIEMTFKGEVVGYDAPNYLVQYGDQFQEAFDEEDMIRYAIDDDYLSTEAPHEPVVEQPPGSPIREIFKDNQDGNGSQPGSIISENFKDNQDGNGNQDDNALLLEEQAKKLNEAENRLVRMDLELSSQKAEIDHLKTIFCDFRDETSLQLQQLQQQEKEHNEQIQSIQREYSTESQKVESQKAELDHLRTSFSDFRDATTSKLQELQQQQQQQEQEKDDEVQIVQSIQRENSTESASLSDRVVESNSSPRRTQQQQHQSQSTRNASLQDGVIDLTENENRERRNARLKVEEPKQEQRNEGSQPDPQGSVDMKQEPDPAGVYSSSSSSSSYVSPTPPPRTRVRLMRRINEEEENSGQGPRKRRAVEVRVKNEH